MLNPEQRAAVKSGFGRDTTFIGGPPGTGKTRTIGTLGEQLARANRSVLLVSHTNTAVDQALLHIAEALGPEAAAEGKILRLGAGVKDRRIIHGYPDLLVKTQVDRLSADLVNRGDELHREEQQLNVLLEAVRRLMELWEWSLEAPARFAGLESGILKPRSLERGARVVCRAAAITRRGYGSMGVHPV